VDGDFHDGFGLHSEDAAAWIREQRSDATEDRKDRMQRLDETA